MSEERCCLCDELTGRAGRADDSLYLDTPSAELGPLCEECYGALDRSGQEERADNLERERNELREKVEAWEWLTESGYVGYAQAFESWVFDTWEAGDPQILAPTITELAAKVRAREEEE
jgi:hypothetical protein